jgi:polar amino acid transport system permease protein
MPSYTLTFWPVLERWPTLIDGLWLSVLLSVVGIVAGSAIGILGALGRTPMTAACLALVLNNGAYTTEIMRAGLAATPHGQIEAAQSLGLRSWQIFAFIVLRPALERVYPTLVSQNVLLMLSTSVTSAIGVQELTGAAGQINSETFRSIEVFMISGALYLALNYLQRLVFWAAGLRLFPHRRARA